MPAFAEEEPAAYEVVVVADAGRFAVDVVALFGDGALRRRIASYTTRRRAEQAARLIERAAHGPGPRP